MTENNEHPLEQMPSPETPHTEQPVESAAPVTGQPGNAPAESAAPATAPDSNQPVPPAQTGAQPQDPFAYHYMANQIQQEPVQPQARQTYVPPMYSQTPYSGQPGGYYPPQQPYYVQPAPPSGSPKGPKAKNTGLRIFVIVLAAVILVMGCFTAGYYMKGNQNSNGTSSFYNYNGTSSDTTSSAATGENPGNTSSFQIQSGSKPSGAAYTYEQVVAAVEDSIVNITVYSSDGQSGSYASGIIMSADGYILTNDHIYANIVKPQFYITLNDGTSFTAQFVAGDARSDIAILKIDNPSGLKPATFGKSSELVAGESVLAMGHSYGLAGTVTDGIVSATARRMTTESGYNEVFIQTTAAINPGNSGGALVNLYGQVVGITSSKIVDDEVEGICFAIPIDTALKNVESMQKYGSVKGRARLGITYNEINAVTAKVNDLPVGLYVQSVDSESGLYGKVSQGDVITKVNGTALTRADDMLDFLDTVSAGDSITVTVYQKSNGESKDYTVKLLEYVGTTNYTTKESTSSRNTNSSYYYPDNSDNSNDFLQPYGNNSK